VSAVDLQIDGDGAARRSRIARRAEEPPADAASAPRGLDVELLEPYGAAAVLDRPHERERRDPDRAPSGGRDEDQPAPRVAEDAAHGARERGPGDLDRVLAELRDEERHDRGRVVRRRESDADAHAG